MRADRFQFPDARLLVFAKAPVPGRAKTRLIPVLGPEGAARVHAELLHATVQRFCEARLAPIELWCAPDVEHPSFQRAEQQFDVALHTQRGADLGERMLNAATDAGRRARALVLVGCDCPDLAPVKVGEALQALLAVGRAGGLGQGAGPDAVLGPATDGGYVLLALKRPEPVLFTAIPWGGNRVAECTRERFRRLGWRWSELDALRDLDRPEDLAWYRSRRSLASPEQKAAEPTGC
jgi:rSAM/selenodomain-associated transferase 1